MRSMQLGMRRVDFVLGFLHQQHDHAEAERHIPEKIEVRVEINDGSQRIPRTSQ
jgi:hypothetical protein